MSQDVTITTNHVTAFGIKYFRGNAPSVYIACVGDKETPLIGQNHILVEDSVPADKLQIRKVTTLDIDQSSATEKNVDLSVTVPLVGKISAADASKQMREDTLKLVLFEILPKDLVAAANATPHVIESLKRIGNDGRLVHKVIVAMQAKTAQAFSNSASLDVSATVKGVKVTAHGGSDSSGSTTIELEPRTTFAYLLLKPKWDASMNKNWKRIEDWEEDQWSFN
ncbi:hypothetical protein [Piscinibacter terrae]|uniref:Uncharacterized protein n=1 Tax=Piscinibacter terrae TaxID=2496871 RepID=A0A3N7HNW0_9BURK|nr:hypothetical protein [Albitalea terrae]RQP23888.1 hypothetical protein DZC73_17400 [Albitalea terrae]